MTVAELFTPGFTREDREYLFRTSAERTGYPAYIIEKDYIVCLVLSLIFEDLKPQFINGEETPFLFKGGTSLSKVYKLIQRMSEGVDLSISMSFLGYPEPAEESNSARDRRVGLLKKRNEEFLRTDFITGLHNGLTSLHGDFQVRIDENEQQNLIVEYPRSLENSDYSNRYIQPHILIETGGRAAFDPHSTHRISPFLSEEIESSLHIVGDCSPLVDVLNVERTFFEKLTLLHELNHRGVDFLSQRQARHLYDLCRIFEELPDVLDNPALLEDVRLHKSKYFRRSSAQWDLAVPGSLFIAPEGAMAVALEEDWLQMADLFPGGELPYTFEQLMDTLREIDGICNLR